VDAQAKPRRWAEWKWSEDLHARSIDSFDRLVNTESKAKPTRMPMARQTPGIVPHIGSRHWHKNGSTSVSQRRTPTDPTARDPQITKT
jgi:hypothetical protein